MTPQATERRAFLPYALGFDLVIVAAGIALLLPPHSAAVLVPFIAAVGLAASRDGAIVGFVTTGFSVVAFVITFGNAVTDAQLILLALIGSAVSALLDTRSVRTGAIAAESVAVAQQGQHELHSIATRIRGSVVRFLMEAGLPALVILVYMNISSILVENFGIRSVLQPLILITGGLVLLCRDEFRPGSAVLTPLGLALTAYCLVAFASSNWARDTAVADADLIDLAKSAMLLLIAASIAVSWRALRKALIALVAGAAIISILTLIQVVIGDPTLQFGGLAKIDQGHLYGDVTHLRPAGPLGDANYLARILILAFPLAAFLGVGTASRREQAMYVIAAALIGAGILFTYSRGGALSLAAVGGLMVLVGRVRVTPANVLVGVLVLVALIPTKVGKRLLTLESLLRSDTDLSVVDASAAKRRQLLGVASRVFIDNPLLGVGIGNFGKNYPAYANLVGLSTLDHIPAGVRQFAHNLYLEIAAETGLAGLLTFLGAMAVALVTLYRCRQALLARGHDGHAAMVTSIALGLAGYLLSSVFLHSGWHRYLWLYLGFAVAADRLTKRSASAPEPL